MTARQNIRRIKKGKKPVRRKQWTDETETSLKMLCTKPSYANAGRAVLSFGCSGRCTECLVERPDNDSNRYRCSFQGLFCDGHFNPSFYRHAGCSINIITLKGESRTKFIFYSSGVDIGALCCRVFKGALAQLVLDGTQLLARIEVLGEENA